MTFWKSNDEFCKSNDELQMTDFELKMTDFGAGQAVQLCQQDHRAGDSK